ncbi:MAG: hypothetical protein Q7V17_08560 [Afipia sp.]|nr:hypothetical protein [Afipia sp.]
MTKEQLFERVVRDRIAMATAATGHSFYYLLDGLEKKGAVALARRYIDPRNAQDFQEGLKVLKHAGLLRLSVEQTIINFHDRGYIFSAAEADAARERLRTVELLVH